MNGPNLNVLSHDTYGNSHVDLRQFKGEEVAQYKPLIKDWIQEASTNGKHMFTVKFRSDCGEMYPIAIQAGLHMHYAHKTEALAKICLFGHSENECNYPKFRTSSTGVTGVVFNEDLTEFVAVQEKDGPYRGNKAITGTVDIETLETPLDAIVREIKEETAVTVAKEQAVFAGHVWTSDFRNGAPDSNLLFVFKVKKDDHQLVAQESEIRIVKWLNVDEFLNAQLPVKHNKPLIIKKVVEAARSAFAQPKAVEKMAWGSGKDAEFYS